MSPIRASIVSFFLVLVAAASAPASETAATAPEAKSFAPLVERTAPAVVNIYARKIVASRSPARALGDSAFWRLFRDTLLFGYGRDRMDNSLGSGVIVSPSGVIVTNHHVVADAAGIVAALADGRAYEAQVLLSDRRTDVAVLRVRPEAPLPSLEFGDSDELRVGDQVLAIGNPFGLGQTVTSGIVSATARTTFGIGDFRFFIQTDAAINPGNSGGAQIDLEGKLVGINTAIFSTSGGSQGLGFAIPANMVRRVVDAAVAGKPLVHPWIGISGRPLPPGLGAVLGLKNGRGVYVAEVRAGGPAATAGFRPGDIILAVGGRPVGDPEALRYRIAMRQPDETVTLTAVRGGTRYDVPVTVMAPPATPERDETRLVGVSPLRGARVASLSPALADELGADNAIAGVVVLHVELGSAAGRLGLSAGDIIRAIDGREVGTVADILAFAPSPLHRWRIAVTRAGSNLVIIRPGKDRPAWKSAGG